MSNYRVAPGRTIQTAKGAYGHPEPCDWLIASDVVLFLADGTIEEIHSTDSLEAPASAVDASDSPSPPVDSGVGEPLAFDLPSSLPSVSKLPAFLADKSADYIRAMRKADKRTGARKARAYSDALKAVR
jgi:hypothetical protein